MCCRHDGEDVNVNCYCIYVCTCGVCGIKGLCAGSHSALNNAWQQLSCSETAFVARCTRRKRLGKHFDDRQTCLPCTLPIRSMCGLTYGCTLYSVRARHGKSMKRLLGNLYSLCYNYDKFLCMGITPLLRHMPVTLQTYMVQFPFNVDFV